MCTCVHVYVCTCVGVYMCRCVCVPADPNITGFAICPADFGIAAQLTQTLMMKRKSFIGTPYW